MGQMLSSICLRGYTELPDPLPMASSRKQRRVTSIGSKKQHSYEIARCLVCSREACAGRKLLKVLACELCIFARFRQHKTRLPSTSTSEALSETWHCAFCAVQQEKAASRKLVTTCVICLIEIRKDDQRARLSFVQQYDPSPLSSDFKGDLSFIIKGTDECIQAHRFILMNRSPVFKKMLEIDMKEKLTGIIKIDGISATVVRAAVNFMYTGEIDFNDQVLPEDVLGFAHQYDIQLLKVLCERDLVKKVSTKTFATMLSISDRFGLDMLKDKARNARRQGYRNTRAQCRRAWAITG